VTEANPIGPHFAVEVEDMAEAKKVLIERGVEFRELGGAGMTIFLLHDPDGNLIELRPRQ